LAAQSALQASEITLTRTKSSLLYVIELYHFAVIELSHLHLLKGTQDLSADLQLLSEIPAERLANIQLADALIAPQAEELYAEGRFRRFPGDGELDITKIVAAIDTKGGLKRIGTEIFGAAIDELTLAEAGRRSAATTEQALQLARAAKGN